MLEATIFLGRVNTLSASLEWKPGAETDQICDVVTSTTDGAATEECAMVIEYVVLAIHLDARDEEDGVTRAFSYRIGSRENLDAEQQRSRNHFGCLVTGNPDVIPQRAGIAQLVEEVA